jgi:hypothetical protein
MNFSCLGIAQAAGLQPGKKVGHEVSYTCPNHDDRHPSLKINTLKDCWLCGPCDRKGNAWELAAFIAGVNPGDKPAVTGWLRDHGLLNGNDSSKRIVATYDYRDEEGTLLYQTVRYEPKGFRQRRPDGNGGWVWNLDGVRLVPYRLPEWKDKPYVYIAEGEKDVDNLWALGIPATCNPMGAGKWKQEYNPSFAGKKGFVLPDNDEPGERHARDVARNLLGVAQEVRIVHLPNLPPKGDVSGWIKAGGTRQELGRIVHEAPVLARNEFGAFEEAQPEADTPIDSRHPSIATEASDLKPSKREGQSWPDPPEADAFYGLAGDIVRTIEPHSEADPVALLVQFLVAFGIAVGRGPYFTAEADRHYTNLFLVLVGRTSKSRKGTSWGHINRLFEDIDESWRDHVKSGLSSGEGLIWAVRDPVVKNDTADLGVQDKRLLVFEAEFASTLRVLDRQGNTLSAIIRDAWDKGNLETLAKNSPAKTTGAHIGIVAHITRDELRSYLNRTETGNGFANRFLFLCVKRSKALPEGGKLNPADLDSLRIRLGEAMEFARNACEMKRDPEASAIWAEVYEELSGDKLGLFGAVTTRAESQVLRLSCLYGLLDKSAVVRKPHLLAALALWEYAENSARFIFGDSLGDPMADELLTALRSKPEGMTRTEIRDFFGRNRRADEIGRALTMLAEHGLASFRAGEETGGRAAEVWFAVGKPTTYTTETTKAPPSVVNVVNVVQQGA